jgi:ribosomal protein S6--L-glutamate ligase
MTRRQHRVCILSRQRALYSTSRLVEAVKAAGAVAVVLDTLKCTLVVGQGGSTLLYRGVAVKPLSVVIPRSGTSITGYGMEVVSHLDAMGVPAVNTARAISRSRDKMRCLQLLAQHGVNVPRTVMALRGGSPVSRIVEEVGGLPCIIKLLRGTQGVGVMIAHSLTEARTILETFWELGQDVIIQEFVAESEGRDVRALVVGDRVVGAMRRVAREGEFRSNIHRGGEGQALQLDEVYTQAAVLAAKAIGLEACGVDILEGRDGPRVVELNSSPGFEGLERATNQDIAGALVRHALCLAEKVG